MLILYFTSGVKIEYDAPKVKGQRRVLRTTKAHMTFYGWRVKIAYLQTLYIRLRSIRSREVRSTLLSQTLRLQQYVEMILEDIRSDHKSILRDSEENHVFVKSATLQRIIARHQRSGTDSQNQQAEDAATITTTKLRFSFSDLQTSMS